MDRTISATYPLITSILGFADGLTHHAMKLVFKIMAMLWLVGTPVALLDWLHSNPSTRALAQQFGGSWQCSALLVIYYGGLLAIGSVLMQRRITREMGAASIQRDMESIRRRLVDEACPQRDD